MEACPRSPFSSSAYKFKISLYATEFKDLSRLCELWYCMEFQFGFVLGPVLARAKKPLPRNQILETILDSEACFGFSEGHGFRLGTLYVSLRAERRTSIEMACGTFSQALALFSFHVESLRLYLTICN